HCQLNNSSPSIRFSLYAYKQNPIQAFHLIAEGIPHQQAIARLKGSARQLSRFTRRAMEKVYPGWEFLDAEDQNMAAFQHSMINGDTNGYRAGFNAALSALEKFVEPITFDDITNSVNSLVEEA
ncbi:hypothetical protein N5I83_29520, partial [Klebsiella variicola]|uniref:hypothetical protein n=1 Tax=Klebsiella variicola TaxID=244366 RepID=UPI0022456CE2